MMNHILIITFACMLLNECITAVVFPYNPRPYRPLMVSSNVKENKCPTYNTRYEDDMLIVILQKGKCEMIVDKFSIQESVSIEGQAVAGVDNKLTYIPKLKFRNLSPICPNLPYVYRGTRVVVQISQNCQLVFAVREFQTMSQQFSQPVLIHRPVIEII